MRSPDGWEYPRGDMLLSSDEIRSLMRAEHGDPFAVLGPHASAEGLWVRALLPGARAVGVVHAASGDPLAMLERQGDSDLFAALVPAARVCARLSTAVRLATSPRACPPMPSATTKTGSCAR